MHWLMTDCYIAVPAVGTTTATVLARAILNEGCKSVAAGMNPMDLRRGINMAVDHVLQVGGRGGCRRGRFGGWFVFFLGGGGRIAHITAFLSAAAAAAAGGF